MRTIAGQPFGKLLLILLAIGLAGYAIWRLSRAPSAAAPRGSIAASTASARSAAGSSTPASASSRSRSS